MNNLNFKSKTRVIFIKDLDAGNKNIWLYLTFFVISLAYGIKIYYFIPLTILLFNFSMN
jgi:hypothetical protein